jgi:Holliday junction resolvasome RuvABC endonuclease subunit
MSKIPRQDDLILGIDPGLTGALAFYHIEDDFPLVVIDMPLALYVTGKGRNQKKHKEVDGRALAAIIQEYAPRIRFAVVEKVHAMPGQGSVSGWRFAESYARVKQALDQEHIDFENPPAAVWKSLMGLSRDKNASRQKVMEMYPENAEDFKRVKDDGRAEALLLAVFGRRFLGHSN